MQVETFVWANKDDPDMYGEWDFEVETIVYSQKILTSRFDSISYIA